MSNLMPHGAQMTSREIADLVGSRHADVKRSIERLTEKGVIQLPPMAFSEEINNLGLVVKREHYVFTAEHKRDTYVVVAQLSPEFTARIVDRWQELERQRAQPAAIPQIELQERTVALAERALNLAERYDDHILRSMSLDSIKNALAGPGAANDRGHFQTYEVMEAMGCSQKVIRSLAPSIGKKLRAAYTALTGEEPKKTPRLVDGATRMVKVYPASFREDAEAIIGEYLSGKGVA